MRKKNVGLTPLLDVFLLLLIVALALVNIPKEEGVVMPKAQALLVFTWDEANTSDVDTWVGLPNGRVINYVQKDVENAALVRDDLGTDANPGDNHEATEFYELLDGIYVVNAHMFYMRSQGPTEVEITFTTFDNYNIRFEETITLSFQNQEITLFTFKVVDGKVVEVRHGGNITLTGGFSATEAANAQYKSITYP